MTATMTTTRPLLIAGIGNLFLGDDAFGCEVLRRLNALYPQQNETVELRDFGVRVRALGYVLAERSEAGCIGTTVIVDALATGAEPGTLQLLDLSAPDLQLPENLSHHALGLADALTLAVALGAQLDRTYLLGCEADSFEPALCTSVLTHAVERAACGCVELLSGLIEQPTDDLVGLCRSKGQVSKTL